MEPFGHCPHQTKAAVPEFPLHGRFCRKLNICLPGWKLEHTDGLRELLRRKVETLPEEASAKAGRDLKTELAELAEQLFQGCPSSHQSASQAFIPLWGERLIFTHESHQERARESKEQEIYKTEKQDNMKVLINYSNVNGLNSSDNIALLNKRTNKNKPLYIPVKEITLAIRIYTF